MRDRPYHHGALREALLEAGFEAARVHGRAGIGIRELAKQVGVSPTAAYRHFPSREHLVAAVAQRARERSATGMQVAMDAIRVDDPAERAWARFLACGRAYVDFALDEPALFETGFPGFAPPGRPDDPDAWVLLVGCLADLAALGELREVDTQAAAVFAWAAVHGLSGILSGPQAPDTLGRAVLTDEVLDAVRRGLRA
ncbi:MAG: TetR/AcrR family transcriptional regulator [Chloroflexota bacterium]